MLRAAQTALAAHLLTRRATSDEAALILAELDRLSRPMATLDIERGKAVIRGTDGGVLVAWPAHEAPPHPGHWTGDCSAHWDATRVALTERRDHYARLVIERKALEAATILRAEGFARNDLTSILSWLTEAYEYDSAGQSWPEDSYLVYRDAALKDLRVTL